MQSGWGVRLDSFTGSLGVRPKRLTNAMAMKVATKGGQRVANVLKTPRFAPGPTDPNASTRPLKPHGIFRQLPQSPACRPISHPLNAGFRHQKIFLPQTRTEAESFYFWQKLPLRRFKWVTGEALEG